MGSTGFETEITPIPKKRFVRLVTDGGSRGNPGRSAVGILILDFETDEVLYEAAFVIGVGTNNQAEYTALLNGLGQCRLIGATDVVVTSDSQLMIRQLNGQYKVKDSRLRKMRDKAMVYSSEFKTIEFVHVPRENPKIQRVDRMLNIALDSTT